MWSLPQDALSRIDQELDLFVRRVPDQNAVLHQRVPRHSPARVLWGRQQQPRLQAVDRLAPPGHVVEANYRIGIGSVSSIAVAAVDLSAGGPTSQA